MRYARATLVKKITDDGITDVDDGVPLGTTYLVDLDSIRKFGWAHVDKPGDVVMRDTVWAMQSTSGRNNGYLPVELLEIEALSGDGATA